MSEQPSPPPPRPAPPSPAALAGRKAAVRRVAPSSVPTGETSRSAEFGRVEEDGTVYVRTGEGERVVGSYPGSTPQEALAYFARKYDEVAGAARLLAQRVSRTDLSAHDAKDSLRALREQIGEANVVGDLAALEAMVADIEQGVAARAAAETEQRAAAKAQAAKVREALVTEAEELAARDPHRVQWKAVSARMRSMLEEWKTLQRSGPRLDKPVESELWQRFSAARSTFDKGRKAWFSQLDDEHSSAKAVKQQLVQEAETLAASRDWGATAGAFKALMQQWRQAGQAQRRDDDVLWERFKAAQDRFFAAKDEVVVAENAEFQANLQVKEALLTQAEALLPVTDLAAAKGDLRGIQERWEAAGKVPREDIARIEARLRKVEQTVRQREEQRWQGSNPEATARARSMVDQLERAVQGLEQDLQAARAGGDERRVAEAQQALEARQQWLESARAGLAEFGG